MIKNGRVIYAMLMNENLTDVNSIWLKLYYLVYLDNSKFNIIIFLCCNKIPFLHIRNIGQLDIMIESKNGLDYI